MGPGRDGRTHALTAVEERDAGAEVGEGAEVGVPGDAGEDGDAAADEGEDARAGGVDDGEVDGEGAAGGDEHAAEERELEAGAEAVEEKLRVGEGAARQDDDAGEGEEVGADHVDLAEEDARLEDPEVRERDGQRAAHVEDLPAEDAHGAGDVGRDEDGGDALGGRVAEDDAKGRKSPAELDERRPAAEHGDGGDKLAAATVGADEMEVEGAAGDDVEDALAVRAVDGREEERIPDDNLARGDGDVVVRVRNGHVVHHTRAEGDDGAAARVLQHGAQREAILGNAGARARRRARRARRAGGERGQEGHLLLVESTVMCVCVCVCVTWRVRSMMG